MKKILLAIILILAIASCQKEYSFDGVKKCDVLTYKFSDTAGYYFGYVSWFDHAFFTKFDTVTVLTYNSLQVGQSWCR